MTKAEIIFRSKSPHTEGARVRRFIQDKQDQITYLSQNDRILISKLARLMKEIDETGSDRDTIIGLAILYKDYLSEYDQIDTEDLSFGDLF